MPIVSLEVAYKWLNYDTYCKQDKVADPGDDPAVSDKYPLQDRQQSKPRRSCLHDASEPDFNRPTLAEQLVAQLRDELRQGNLAEARAKASQIEMVCSEPVISNSGSVFLAEAHLECGLVYREIGENSRALEYFQKSLLGFTGHDLHGEAIVRWIIGIIQLETPRVSLNQGLVSWQAAWKFFARAANDTSRPKVEGQWYKRRSELMAEDLKAAIAQGRLPETARPAAETAGSPVRPPPASSGGAGAPGAAPPPSLGTSNQASTQAPPSGVPSQPGDVTPPPPHPPGSPDSAEPGARGPFSLVDNVLPGLAPLILGDLDSPVAEGELFWSHDLRTEVRLVSCVGGDEPQIVLEREDHLNFPAENGKPGKPQKVFSQADFERRLGRNEFIWLQLPRPAAPQPSTAPTVEEIPGPSAAAAWLQLAGIPVCESIAANPWGTEEARVNEGEFGALTLPWLLFEFKATGGNPQRFRLLSFRREGLVRLNPHDRYAFMRVVGDSMNLAKPYPLQPGDVVLVRQTVKAPDDYKIVVANVYAEDTHDYKAVVKRKRADGLYSESQVQYPVILLSAVAGYVGEVMALAKPVAAPSKKPNGG